MVTCSRCGGRRGGAVEAGRCLVKVAQATAAAAANERETSASVRERVWSLHRYTTRHLYSPPPPTSFMDLGFALNGFPSQLPSSGVGRNLLRCKVAPRLGSDGARRSQRRRPEMFEDTLWKKKNAPSTSSAVDFPGLEIRFKKRSLPCTVKLQVTPKQQ